MVLSPRRRRKSASHWDALKLTDWNTMNKRSNRSRAWFVCTVLSGALTANAQSAAKAPSNGIGAQNPASGSNRLSKPNRFRIWRDRRAILQRTSFTCGPAALANLMTHYLDKPSTEALLARLAGTYEHDTTSIYGLVRACRFEGFEAAGFHMTLDELMRSIEDTDRPALVRLVQPRAHYVMVVGREGKSLLVTDPARGKRRLSESDFVTQWNGDTLIVRPARNSRATRSVEAKYASLR